MPFVQGGTLLTSVAFLLFQDAALALAALVMLPVQLTLLPRLRRRLNAKVRERVHATRTLGGLLTAPEAGTAEHPPVLLQQMRQAEALERVRIEIADLKGRLKGLYNYTANLTPFFFFSVGGYLLIQGRLSLGALVATLAAYKEISPALRELFGLAQGWSDASPVRGGNQGAQLPRFAGLVAHSWPKRWRRGSITEEFRLHTDWVEGIARITLMRAPRIPFFLVTPGRSVGFLVYICQPS